MFYIYTYITFPTFSHEPPKALGTNIDVASCGEKPPGVFHFCFRLLLLRIFQKKWYGKSYGYITKKCNHWITELFNYQKSLIMKCQIQWVWSTSEVCSVQTFLSWNPTSAWRNAIFSQQKRCSYWLRWMENKHQPALYVGIWASYLVEKKHEETS